MINDLSYLSFLNNKIFETNEELNYKYGLNKLLLKDSYEFNLYKENIKYLVTETLDNDALFRYVLKNMKNKNYIFAISMSLLDSNSNIIGSLSLTKKTYTLCLYKLIELGLNDKELVRAHNLINYTTIEEAKNNNSYSITTVTLNNGNKLSVNNIDLINIFINREYINEVSLKYNMSINDIKLVLLKFASTGILKKYLFNNDAYILEEELKTLDISNIYIESLERPKLNLNLNIYYKLFDYMEESYNPLEILFSVYKRMKEYSFSIQTLALVAENLSLEYTLISNVLEVRYEEYNIEFTKERYRILTTNESTRNKIYELDDKITENIIKNKTKETKLFNNLAYYKNFYLTDGPGDSEKLVTFLRVVSYINDFDSDYINKIKHIYKKVLGKDSNTSLHIISNNIKNKELNKIIPIVIVKYNNNYYVVDHSSNIKVNNYKDINNYLEAKEYYYSIYKGDELLNVR